MNQPHSVLRGSRRESVARLLKRHLHLVIGVLAAAMAFAAPARADIIVLDVYFDGESMCATVHNNGAFSQEVGLVTYQIMVPTTRPFPTPEELHSQVLHDWDYVTVGPGETVEACIDVPDCMPLQLFQFDMFHGPVVVSFEGSDYYDGRLLYGWIYDNPCMGDEGCTPGYWKSHEGAWAATGYSPAQTLESVFDVPNAYGLDNMGLLAAMSLKGGPAVADKAALLCHHAVAALLNAAHADVDYPLTVAQVIAQVNAALASGDGGAMEELKNRLDEYNNGGCPLN